MPTTPTRIEIAKATLDFRTACNFAFPAEYPRPLPDKGDKSITENEFNGVTQKMLHNMEDYIGETDGNDEAIDEEVNSYQQRINKVLEILKYNPLNPREQEFLTKDGQSQQSIKFS